MTLLFQYHLGQAETRRSGTRYRREDASPELCQKDEGGSLCQHWLDPAPSNRELEKLGGIEEEIEEHNLVCAPPLTMMHRRLQRKFQVMVYWYHAFLALLQ